MKKLLFLFLAVAMLAANDDADTKKPKPHFPIGKETTYVTAPLDAEGYIDYAAALNERMCRGVTPANNAHVLLWKALGPHPGGVAMPKEFFQRIGIEPPPEKGDYFIDLSRYLKEQLKVDPVKEGERIHEELRRRGLRSWTPEQHPTVASWLKANEKPLAVVIEATQRSHYFLPLVPRKMETDNRFVGLVGVPLPTLEQCRLLAGALAARAMLRVGQSSADDAWQDLIACHRLGRLVGQGATLAEGSAGYAIDGTACWADLAFLEGFKPDAKRLESCLRDLRKLPSLSCMAEKVEFGERFMVLYMVANIARHGNLMGNIRFLEGLPDQKPEKADGAEKLLQDMDWDSALRNVNRWFDRLSASLAEKDRGPREKKLKQIFLESITIRGNVATGETAKQLRSGKTSRDKVVSDILVSLVVPVITGSHNRADCAQQTQDNVIVAFALACYQREHGHYPKELTALAPKYLEHVPRDLFSRQALIYRPDNDGYLLYSVGVNGQDELGRSSDDDPPGDDLTINMPVPKLKQK